MSVDPHQPLRDDVRLLGEVLGRVLRHHEGDEIFERVEQVREAAKKARTLDSELEHIDRLLRDMPMASALTVARAFAHFLTLANIAEQHHRVHRRRDHARDPARPAAARLRRRDLRAAATGRRAGRRARRVDPLDARRAGLHRASDRDRSPHAAAEAQPHRRDSCVSRSSRPDAGRAGGVAGRSPARDCGRVADRRSAPRACHPARRSAGGTRCVRAESVGCAAAVSAGGRPCACRQRPARALPLDVAPIRFGSWIGGDRDGNPSITPEVTRQATWLARWQAADLYLKDIVALRSELSLSAAHASDELRARVGAAHEPYRALLAEVRDRLAGDARSGRRGARGVCAEADGHRALPRGGRARGAAGALLPLAHVDRQRASSPAAGSPTFCVA